MRPRFQADDDLNEFIIKGLKHREPAISFQTAVEGRVKGFADPEVLAIAAREDRILVSHDLKTMPQHFASFIQNRRSPGLILVRQKLDLGVAIEQLLLLWATRDHHEWQNLIWHVKRG